MAASRDRADRLLLGSGLVEDLKEGQALILAAKVLWTDVAGREARVDSAGQMLPTSARFRLKGRRARFVSRAGEKLEHALLRFDIPVQGCFCVDVGISTGGFTDCLLQRGARKVLGIDVGYGDVHHRIRTDPRVQLLERTHARDVERTPEPVQVLVADVSFIRLGALLPRFATWMAAGGAAILLVKPQFELEASRAPGGIVEDPKDRKAACEQVRRHAEAADFRVLGLTESPVRGSKGNQEFLMALQFDGAAE